MVGRRAYNFMYRTWAPWEGETRPELADLVTSGRIAPGRAIDLGCGSGANSIFLAEHGFDVTGVDYSPVVLAKARRATPPSLSIEWLPGDLTATSTGSNIVSIGALTTTSGGASVTGADAVSIGGAASIAGDYRVAGTALTLGTTTRAGTVTLTGSGTLDAGTMTGIAGLTIAHDLAARGYRVLVLEAAERTGGTAAKLELPAPGEDALALDAGAESFAVRGGAVAELIGELGLADDIVEPNDAGAWLLLPGSGGSHRAVPLPKR